MARFIARKTRKFDFLAEIGSASIAYFVQLEIEICITHTHNRRKQLVSGNWEKVVSYCWIAGNNIFVYLPGTNRVEYYSTNEIDEEIVLPSERSLGRKAHQYIIIDLL